MGYSVYWENGRWQGYGVLAYCDHPGCKKEIDRGMGYANYNCCGGPPPAFFCSEHMPDYDHEMEEYDIDLNKEHPEWLTHILTDDSWEEWRKSQPETVSRYKKLLEEHNATT